jgi:hypothetical protein
VQHGFGMTGQIAAALPLLLITVLISRTVSLEAAGRFVVVVGVSATAFAGAQWGLRSFIVLDGFRRFAASDYLATRALGTAVAALVTLGAALALGLTPLLGVGLVLYRAADATIDLGLSLNQVWQGSGPALRSYALQHLAKLLTLLVLGCLPAAFAPQHVPLALAVSGAIALAGAGLLLGRGYASARAPARPSGWRSILGVLRGAIWFAVAAGVCALATNAPRLALPKMYSGDTLGVMGVSLSVCTLYGMAFYTTWLRYLPRFSLPGARRRAVALRFVAETCAVSALLLAAGALVLPPAVALVFGFEDELQQAQARQVLLAGVVFFGGMSMTNLYKVTPFKWLEPLTFSLAIAGAVGLVSAAVELRNVVVFLLASGVLMALLSGLAWRYLETDEVEGGRGDSQPGEGLEPGGPA